MSDWREYARCTCERNEQPGPGVRSSLDIRLCYRELKAGVCRLHHDLSGHVQYGWETTEQAHGELPGSTATRGGSVEVR